jgi:hypothetical protein
VKENCNTAKVLYLRTCEDVTGNKSNTIKNGFLRKHGMKLLNTRKLREE